MVKISETLRTVLEKKSFVHLATIMPDGSPQVSPVWVDLDGDRIMINSAEGRLKDRNIRRDARVGLSVTDPDNPYHCYMLRGRVTEITNDGADDHIDRMAKKYIDQDKYPFRTPEEVRVLYYIELDKLSSMGS
ncbi:MAG: PPOX class F420-dependent oxidoreductase [Proteobacteria bacterium]|nr:PPOX class F420-dependent oxidoreductase [Pseudomonadota bacterium]